jgi:RND family efflux transporter MFP subunit
MSGDPRTFGARYARRLAPVVVLAVGAALSLLLLESPPKAARQRPAPEARVVEVAVVRFESRPTVVEAMGSVRPAREVVLRSQVAGAIVERAAGFEPGGRVAAGTVLLRIDPRDYELAVQQRRSELSEAEAALAIERGSQDVARREYELLGEVVADGERGLVLREPQLRTARAGIARAQAALAEAELALERTTVRAPFDATVRERSVDVGAQVDPASTLGTLVGTELYWVEAAVPVRKLRWLRLPRDGAGGGSAVRIYDDAAWDPGVSRAGTVVELLSAVEDEGRMARLLIAVDDPLGRAAGAAPTPLLLLGAFVRAEIEGRRVEQVAVLDRRAVHEGDRVWIMDGDDRLEIRPVTVVFRGRNEVLVSDGLAEGERVITSSLAAPVASMPLRLAAGADAAPRRAE